MGENHLRRLTWLKFVVHIIMAISFLSFLFFVVVFLTFINSRYSSMRTKESFLNLDLDDSDYFSSQMFVDVYGEYIDELCSALETMEYGNSGGYPLSAFMENNVNFKYGVYSPEGKLMYFSDDWSAQDFRNSEENESEKENESDMKISHLNNTDHLEQKYYYYTIDMNHLNLFNVKIIRQADFANQAGSNRGLLEYGSNFTKYTSFYSYDESFLSGSVGYICTYVPSKLVQGDRIYDNYLRYIRWKALKKWEIAGIGISFVVMIICLMYLVISAGYSKKSDTLVLYRFDKWFTEISALLIISIVIYAMALGWQGIFENYWFDAVVGVGVAYIVGVFGILSFARRLRAHVLIENSLIYKLGKGLKYLIHDGLVKGRLFRKYVLILIIFGILDILLAISVIVFRTGLWTMIVMMIYLYQVIVVGYKLLQLERIQKGAREIASGNLTYKIDTINMDNLLENFAGDINNIGRGLNAAVDERMKSERMKAELITNVSHDLKTPLTSIINYVDLLKREPIESETAKEYIKVLDEKSQRLKALTEDLVEASRATSGNIKLELNTINFVELVLQAVGTYQEKFDAVNLEMVLRYAPETMLIMADGRRLYRVLDNLLNNVCKYAMPGTRVYIDMYVENRRAWMVMKNISKTQLTISADTLTQRFVRGDWSRSTEGSGLGLSIARSLTELHDGIFDIALDGDLFKVSVALNCLNEKETI